jgi:hypothetical protein
VSIASAYDNSKTALTDATSGSIMDVTNPQVKKRTATQASAIPVADFVVMRSVLLAGESSVLAPLPALGGRALCD